MRNESQLNFSQNNACSNFAANDVSELVVLHKFTSQQLKVCAAHVPGQSAEKDNEMEQFESDLHDVQDMILLQASQVKISTRQEAKSLLELWQDAECDDDDEDSRDRLIEPITVFFENYA